ncbi:MAG: peroxiredoxin, partial [Thiovulaceae bacterium]|nr:peroxiredoxin [Sulfurimonadaceae bacterium]
MLEIGTKAPEFCLPNQDDVEICSRDVKGKWIVLYFYPKDNTPGCTTEACDFTEAMPQYQDLDAIILGVSADSPKKHQNFIAKQNLGITLLSDESTNMMQAYDVWKLKMNYGREYMGIVRTTYIIDPNGDIVASWDKVKVRQKRKKDGETYEIVHVEE